MVLRPRLRGGVMLFNVFVSHRTTLRIRYRGPSASGRGARLTVSETGASKPRRITIPYRYDLSDDERRQDAVKVWCERFNAHPYSDWIVSSMSGDESVAVLVPGKVRTI